MEQGDKVKIFKPLKASNKEYDIEDLTYPVMASYKIDGIRCVQKEGHFLSNSLKQIQNIQIREKFEPVRKFTEDNHYFMDNEIYNHALPFSMISSCVMTIDHTTKEAVKAWAKLCVDYDIHITREEAIAGMKLWCFDAVANSNFDQPYKDRYTQNVCDWSLKFPELVERVEHVVLNNPQEVREFFQQALDAGFEGLMLRNPDGIYKFGRASFKQNIIHKLKLFITLDAIIKDILQATVVNPDAEKKTNELGRSVTSKKKEDRILDNKVSDFVVDYNGKDCKVSCSKMTHPERERCWGIRESLIGKWIEYKGMETGSKDVLRHPNFIRFREDKDE